MGRVEVLFPVLSGLNWIAITVLAYMNPSRTLAAAPVSTASTITLVISTVAAVLLPFIPLVTRKKRSFLAALPSTLALLLLATWLNATSIHRDFFTFMTQSVFLYLAIFIWRVPDLQVFRRRKVAYQTLFALSVLVFALWNFWLMAMGYAIVTRDEPRWIEATVYNVLNGVLGLSLIPGLVRLWLSAKKNIVVLGDRIELDGFDISTPLSPQENQLLLEFLRAPGQALTCARLQRLIESGNDGNSSNQCEVCITELWKPTACSTYRHIKKQIGYAKKYLEITQMGTIVPVSQNPRRIKEMGWHLRFFDDVRLDSNPSTRVRGRIFAPPRQ